LFYGPRSLTYMILQIYQNAASQRGTKRGRHTAFGIVRVAAKVNKCDAKSKYVTRNVKIKPAPLSVPELGFHLLIRWTVLSAEFPFVSKTS